MKKLKFLAVFGLVLIFSLAITAAQDMSSFGEAPMLASLVESGDLPPVEERLPSNPVGNRPMTTVSVTMGVNGVRLWSVAWIIFG